jgi:hypothetical protein
MGDLPACLDDINAFKECMKYYDLTDPDNIYELHNKSFRECNKTFINIKNRLKKEPETNYIIFIVAAGHGMNSEGQQVLLVNEYKPANKFYKWLAIEEYIRAFAKIFPNSYTLAFFACCREIYSFEKH